MARQVPAGFRAPGKKHVKPVRSAVVPAPVNPATKRQGLGATPAAPRAQVPTRAGGTAAVIPQTPATVAVPRVTGLGARPLPTAPAPAPLAPAVPFAEREDRVDVLAAGMMAQDSPLMQKARASGLQAANRRGLLNSSIAVGAAESAALDQVVPMASQTAAQNASRNQAGQAYTFDRSKMMLQGDIQQRLAAQGFDFDVHLRSAEAGFQQEQTRLEAALQERVTAAQLTGEDRRGAQASVDNVFNDYQDSIRSIMSNPDLPASERTAMMASAKDLVKRRMDMTSRIYGTAFDWPKGMFGIKGASAPRQNGGQGRGLQSGGQGLGIQKRAG